jgi:hypothetical protein
MNGDDRGAAFTFRREGDGLTYRFEPAGAGRWKRTDADLWCGRQTESWAIVDGSGQELGWPIGATVQSDVPPAGPWRSEKAGKSYLYRLEWE